MEQQHAQQHHVAWLERGREQPHAMLPRKLDRMQPVLASQTVRAARAADSKCQLFKRQLKHVRTLHSEQTLGGCGQAGRPWAHL
jgi:hypothetical protein